MFQASNETPLGSNLGSNVPIRAANNALATGAYPVELEESYCAFAPGGASSFRAADIGFVFGSDLC